MCVYHIPRDTVVEFRDHPEGYEIEVRATHHKIRSPVQVRRSTFMPHIYHITTDLIAYTFEWRTSGRFLKCGDELDFGTKTFVILSFEYDTDTFACAEKDSWICLVYATRYLMWRWLKNVQISVARKLYGLIHGDRR